MSIEAETMEGWFMGGKKPCGVSIQVRSPRSSMGFFWVCFVIVPER